MLTAAAPAETAVFTAVAKSPVDVSPSFSPSCHGTEISRMWHDGHAADAMSTSSEVSTPICSSALAPSPLLCGAGWAPPS